MTDTTILKLALLADWQHLCHDDFDEDEDMNEDEYWESLQKETPESLRKLEEEDFDEERTPQSVLDLYTTYLSPKYQDMIPRKPMNITPAVESILNTYDSEELEQISERKFTLTDKVEFFDKHEEDIYDYLRAAFGDDFLFKLVTECPDMNAMKNKLVWTYTELVAKEYFAQMSSDEDLDGYDELYYDEEDEEEDNS